MNINSFSNKYKVRELIEKDIPIIYKLCSGNIIYYTYCPPFVDEERIIEDMTELPPGKGREDKYYVGFFDGDQLIGVLDIIDGYPGKEIAYIGFFMTDTSVQRKGIGAGIIDELCVYLKEQGFFSVQLAYVIGNEQSKSFWHKMGFEDMAIEKQIKTYRVKGAERIL